MDPKFTGPGQPFTLHANGLSYTFWGQITMREEPEKPTSEPTALPDKIEVTGSFTATFVNYKLLHKFRRGQERRRRWLERMTGLGVTVIDE